MTWNVTYVLAQSIWPDTSSSHFTSSHAHHTPTHLTLVNSQRLPRAHLHEHHPPHHPLPPSLPPLPPTPANSASYHPHSMMPTLSSSSPRLTHPLSPPFRENPLPSLHPPRNAPSCWSARPRSTVGIPSDKSPKVPACTRIVSSQPMAGGRRVRFVYDQNPSLSVSKPSLSFSGPSSSKDSVSYHQLYLPSLYHLYHCHRVEKRGEIYYHFRHGCPSFAFAIFAISCMW